MNIKYIYFLPFCYTKLKMSCFTAGNIVAHPDRSKG